MLVGGWRGRDAVQLRRLLRIHHERRLYRSEQRGDGRRTPSQTGTKSHSLLLHTRGLFYNLIIVN